MAIAVDATSAAANTVTSVSSVTWSHTCASSATMLVVACTLIRVSGDITGVTYNGVALTRAATTGFISSQSSQLWYLFGPSSGANNIVVSYTDASTFEPKNGAISFTGTETSFGGATNTANGAAGSISTSITTNKANSYIVDVVGSGNTDIGSPGGSQTQIWINNNGAGSQDGASSYRSTTTAGSYSMTWTGGQVWQGAAMEIREGSGDTNALTMGHFA